MLKYYTPKKKGIKICIGKKRVGNKLSRIDVSVPMSNVLQIDTDNMSSAIVSLTGEVMKYNESGYFILDKREYEKKVIDESLFTEHKECIYFKITPWKNN